MPLVKLISQEIVYVMLFHWLGSAQNLREHTLGHGIFSGPKKVLTPPKLIPKKVFAPPVSVPEKCVDPPNFSF